MIGFNRYKTTIYAFLVIGLPVFVSDIAKGQTGDVAKAQGSGVSTGDVASLKKEIKDLAAELSAFKSQAATLTATVSNINSAMATITNDIQIARPNQIPADVRYLANFMNRESVVVHNKKVYTVKSPLLNTFGLLLLFDPTYSTETNTVTIEEKLIQLRKDADPSISQDELMGLSPHEHVEALYMANKIEDWQFHRLRYGVSTFYNSDLGGLGAGITLRGYPAYSRYMDGRFLDLENAFWRRLSVQVSIGGMLTRDDEKADSTGLVGTLGLGWDVVYGITLFAGESFYSYSKPGEDGGSTDHATVFGVTLNSEFWRTLFGGK